jgi:hypothetical protein
MAAHGSLGFYFVNIRHFNEMRTQKLRDAASFDAGTQRGVVMPLYLPNSQDFAEMCKCRQNFYNVDCNLPF